MELRTEAQTRKVSENFVSIRNNQTVLYIKVMQIWGSHGDEKLDVAVLGCNTAWPSG
jgi:hypothetical protein